jgi:hypothetical protein
MDTPVKLEDLLTAHEWLGACEAAGMQGEAYVSRATGTVHWCGDGIDEDVPEDIEDGTLYVAVPSQRDLHLGRSVALCFVEEQMPDHFDTVAGYFERRGAYARFKTLLERAGRLEDWHRYEEAATEQALRAWCERKGLVVAGPPSEPGDRSGPGSGG